MRQLLVHTVIIALLGILVYFAAVTVYTPNTGKILLFGYVLLTPRLYEFLGAIWERASAPPQATSLKT